MASGKLNGKVDILAKAMADVFQECMEPVDAKIEKLREDTNQGFVEVNQQLQEMRRELKPKKRKGGSHVLA